METPSSTRRVARSQASSLASHKKQEDATTRSRTGSQSDRAVLSDITNDSPIVGLAVEKTPSSAVAKSLVHSKRTPGSGEALLRGQVKNLLEKVGEEGAGLAKKTSSGNRSLFLRASVGFPFSPAQLLAPTPTNTPLVPSLSVFKEEGKGSMTSPSNEEVVDVTTTLDEEEGEEEKEVSGNECVINRALLFDSPGKSEGSDDVSSTVTYQGSLEKSSPDDDDSSSAWSLQVNVSGIQEDDEEDGEVEDDDDDESLQGLCEELMNMTVNEERKRVVPEFAGKHTRFTYNSDDELEGEEVVAEKTEFAGKHTRFTYNSDDELVE
ncbi:hypothetical protein J5N97_018816 [Dioscorea zingiberensis]|uniref:Chalcone-flavanone isomerase family protein n=1 Tax=Dioscorea zingiberensis TaxID=325984 RepID=A0A9D5CDU5_9LILI|nr:hypothetical protein J5N97_018816 [Dioscorea zingiberensis]